MRRHSDHLEPHLLSFLGTSPGLSTFCQMGFRRDFSPFLPRQQARRQCMSRHQVTRIAKAQSP